MSQEQTLFQKLLSQKEVENLANSAVRHSLWLKIVIISATVALCSLFFMMHIEQQIEEPDKFKLIPGYVWSGATLKAEFTFPVYKSNNDYQSELREARNSTALVFLHDQSKEAVLMEKVMSIIDSLKNISSESNKKLEEPIAEKALLKFLELNQNQRNQELSKMKRELGIFISQIYKSGFVNVNLEKINHNEITVRIPPNREFPLLKSGLSDRGSFISKLQAFTLKELSSSAEIAFDIVSKFAQPNLTYSEELTERAKQFAEKSVPKTSGIVRKDETIISKGDVLSDEIIPKIKSYQTSRQLRSDNSISLLGVIGSLGHSAIIYSILILYLFFIRKKNLL